MRYHKNEAAELTAQDLDFLEKESECAWTKADHSALESLLVKLRLLVLDAEIAGAVSEVYALGVRSVTTDTALASIQVLNLPEIGSAEK